MLLSEHEMDRLIEAALRSEPRQGPAEIEAIVRWAEKARLDKILLDMVTEGTIQPIWDGEEVAFYVTGEVREKFGPRRPDVIDVDGLF